MRKADFSIVFAPEAWATLGRTPQGSFVRLREALESAARSVLLGEGEVSGDGSIQAGDLIADYVLDPARRELTVVALRQRLSRLA
jgi:hypothetical protein